MRSAGSPKLIYIIAGALALTFLLSSSGLRQIFLLRAEIARLEESIERVREDNKTLTRKLHWIENEPEYMEYLARKNLGLIMPGERKYYIIDEPQE